MKLFGYWRSSASWRVRIALAWKDLPYDFEPIHLVRDGGEQHRESYLSRNPMAQVPLLDLGEGRSLSQSVAILEYLEEAHPTPSLLPSDLFLRAKVRQMTEIMNSGIQPLHNLATIQAVEKSGGDRKAWARGWIEKGLGALEREASHLAGKFCVGDQVTFADLCLIPQLYAARRFEVDVSAFPTLARIEGECAGLPAFQKAHAEAQPDAAK